MISYIYVSNRYQARVEYFMFTSVAAFFGGGATFMTGAYSYITDVSRESHRTARIAVADMFMASAYPFGNILSAPLYWYAGGYYGIFGCGLVLSVINMTYIMLYVKETRGPRAHPRYATVQHESNVASDQGGEDTQPRNLLSLSHLKSVFTTAMKERPNKMRTVLLMLISAMILNQAANRKYRD